jgi:hypothetical protein
MYRDKRVVVVAATMATAPPECPSTLTRTGRRVDTTGGGRLDDGRGGPAAADSSLLLPGTKHVFVLVDVRVAGACIEVEAR